MLELKDLKEIETVFRQFGYEAEDIFNAIAYFYVNIFSIETSENLRKIIQKGEIISQVILKDNTNGQIIEKIIDNCIRQDKSGNNLTVFYQYFLGKRFRDITGKFFTPHKIAKSMVKMLPIKPHALIIDPTCGCGTFLKEISNFWQNTPCHLIANDVDNMLVCLTELILKINQKDKQQYQKNISLFTANIYSPPQQIKSLFGKVDYILANPPFSLPINRFSSESELFASGYRNSDALFIDLALELLKPHGRLVSLLPHSIISNKEYEKLRQIVEKNWLLTAIITLPEGVFQTTANTTTRADIIVLDKKGEHRTNKKTIFANISSIGIPLNGKQKNVETDDLENLLKDPDVISILGI
ncbi:N-6 DNA methylase [Cuspidothrix issatschenkoi LEGE 03284]|uniref:HsdM family class I SAM-dependent methyltransferase n=1 Tax=Cuspidothrix issatschenkoi TaxID=230752 RepID=UPI00187F1F43|nr:N-6 DNA methylase [Cuspidothrix issatschenkoi]MBE9233276.1 N-6 DNA methylase [Cuspidothrix issatschenkoi LEGE 03284]